LGGTVRVGSCGRRVPTAGGVARLCGVALLLLGAALNAGTVTDPNEDETEREGTVAWVAWKPAAPMPDESSQLEEASLILGKEPGASWSPLPSMEPAAESDMLATGLLEPTDASLDLGGLQSLIDRMVAARQDTVDFLLRVGQYFFLGRALHQMSARWYRRAWSSADDAHRRGRAMWHQRGRNPGGAEVFAPPKETRMSTFVRSAVSYLFGGIWIVGAIAWFRARRAEKLV